MTRIITCQAFCARLVEAGIMTQEEVNRTGHIVIDVRPDRPVTMYIERFAEMPLLDVVLGLNGIEIKYAPHHCDRADEHVVTDDCIVRPVPLKEKTDE